MTVYYVRSTDGANADSGATWALAKADVYTTAWGAGDVIYVSDNHAESTAAAITIASAGTAASPTKIYGVDDAAEPPTALSTTATVTTTGTSSITISAASNGAVYVYGINFNVGTSTGAGNFSLTTSARFLFESCNIAIVNTSASSGVLSGSAGCRNIYKNCGFKFAAVGQGFNSSGNGFTLEIDGGSILSGGTTPTTIFDLVHTGILNVSGFDFSNCSAGVNLVTAGLATKSVFRDCRLPASWSGALATGTLIAQERHEMYNCDSADTNYRIRIMDYSGTLDQDTTVYSDVGATDGTTRLSWKVVTTANAEYPNLPFVTPEIMKWNDTTGSALTVTVEINHASAGAGTNGCLQNDEIWLEVMYLGTSGVPLGTWTSNRKVPLATAADHATTSTAWTGDSAGWDTQKLVSASITPQEKGYIVARVCVAKASATVYIDPLLTVA